MYVPNQLYIAQSFQVALVYTFLVESEVQPEAKMAKIVLRQITMINV